jgi:protein-S-isoprenylcysteine O-methyltransferase Ste14/uncharacterized protein (UPF0548 family)
LCAPWLVFELEGASELSAYRFEGSTLRWVGGILFGATSVLALWSCFVLSTRGAGTPLPFDCPSKLVIAGPYRVVRNPMAVSGILQGVAVGLFLGSPAVLMYVGAGFIIAEVLIQPWEERDLEERFGLDFRRYRHLVPVWCPRLGLVSLVPAGRLRGRPWDCELWQSIDASAHQGELGALSHKRFEIVIPAAPPEVEGDQLDRGSRLVLRYGIYPPFRMAARVCSPEGKIEVGVTIIQRIFLGRVGFEAAVRVVEVFDHVEEGGRVAGFTYTTLIGHPERGLITFSVRPKGDESQVQFRIESWSAPSSLLLKLTHFMGKRIQVRSNEQALEHVRYSLLTPGPPSLSTYF